MRPFPLISALALSTALVAASAPAQRAPARAARPAAPAAVQPIRTDVPSQLPRSVRPLHYTIRVAPDAANMRFAGNVSAQIQVLEPTDTITLNSVDIDFDGVTLTGPGTNGLHPTGNHRDDDNQTTTFRFAGRLAPGAYRLDIAYRGKIETQAAGFFALDYDAADGSHKRALFTQFEAPDARRFFPGWDEPQFRTPYDLSVVVPAGQDAVGNMPIARRDRQANGASLVTFQTTPAMSSYLLFLGVGEFDRITTRVAGTEIGVVTRRGAGEQGRWALDSAARILPWYNAYFGTNYPLPKLDNIAGPGSSQFFGAMENWGGIFTFENVLLVDPAITTESRRQAIFTVAAHEMAHQWFGDLVTMAWWNDIWLNEGFASWMETKASAAIHPEWEPLLGRIDGREAAVQLDSLRTTHPIVQDIHTVDQMSQAFDAITYQKGEAVITMLEDYVGETAWRTGVRAYIQRHRLGNTVTDDLWRSIEAAAGRPITAIAHDFTLQPGVPLIRVASATCAGGRTRVALNQARFSRDDKDGQSPRWRVPVIAAAGGAGARALVQGGAGQLTVPGCGPLVVNYGQTGYYRTLYAPALLDRLIRGYAQLRPVDQIGLLADNWSLGLAGYQNAAAALDMADAAPANPNTNLSLRIAGILGQINGMYDADPAHQAMVGRYAAAKLGPALRRVGWAARPNEAANDAILRDALIGTLGGMGNEAVVAEANRRFAANDPSVTGGPLRETILGIIAYNADARTWDRLRQMARAERNPLVKQQLYRFLGQARDPAIAQRALDLALTDEPGTTNSSSLISAVSGNHPDLAFDFALAHRERVEALVDASSRSRYLAGLASRSSDPAMIEKLRRYADQHMTAQSRAPADRAIASIQDRVRVRRDRLPDLTRWFDARRG
jgi:aminopeptidase N